jgi:hypothetical protein
LYVFGEPVVHFRNFFPLLPLTEVSPQPSSIPRWQPPRRLTVSCGLGRRRIRTRDCRTTAWCATIELPCLPLSYHASRLSYHASRLSYHASQLSYHASHWATMPPNWATMPPDWATMPPVELPCLPLHLSVPVNVRSGLLYFVINGKM